MPLPIQFDWSEDESMLYFVLHARGAKAKNMDVLLSDVYVKVNCHPAMFDADLLHEIDPDHPKTRCRVGADKVTLSLKKKEPGLWEEFRAKGTKAELRERRQVALDSATAREKARLEKRDEWRQELLKNGETHQWRLDQENREQIDKWQKEEKDKWEDSILASFDEETGDLQENMDRAPMADGDLDAPDEGPKTKEEMPAPSTNQTRKVTITSGAMVASDNSDSSNVVEVTNEEAEQIRAQRQQDQQKPQKIADSGAIWSQEELDDTEEYVPDVRENPGKIGIRFTARPRAGVPVRDRGQRAPPFPKHQVKADQPPPMLEGDAPGDESDPIWLKDKADKLMANGDYQGACHAYTEALKLALNARAFANRAVAQLYLGNFEQCLEDCHHGLRILDKRQSVHPGQIPGPSDPQDQAVRARIEIRMGTAYLWLGAFNKAEENFQKALDTEDGLLIDERNKVKEDLARVKAAKAALSLKEKADSAADRAYAGTGTDREKDSLDSALGLYQEACDADPRSAVIVANRTFARLRAGQYQECVEDGATALDLLKQWPTARRAPKKPERPAHLDPPFLDDPTFTHPDQQKQGEVDWLMKHGGGSSKDLPSLPLEFEWVKDVAEKNENSWIAIRKKMPKATIDAIRRATVKLQDVLYTRNPRLVREQIEVAIEENRAGEGPSGKAIRESGEFADKLEAYEKERETEREKELEEARQEIEDYDLDAALAATRTGVAQTGFGRGHPLERTKRRLFVKVLLRRARAFEALGDKEACAAELQRVLRAEPQNAEGKQLLAALAVPSPSPFSPSAPASAEASAAGGAAVAPGAAGASGALGAAVAAAVASAGMPAVLGAVAGGEGEQASSGRKAKAKASAADDDLDDDDDDDEGVDHSSTSQLLSAAAEYMRKNDYQGALEIYGYAKNRTKVWDSALTELKVLSNRSLCLQRCRGRLPELITACNEALTRMAALKREPDFGGMSEEMLLKMQSACLSRRGNAYMQQRKAEEGNRDLAEVRTLLARVEALEAQTRPALAC